MFTRCQQANHELPAEFLEARNLILERQALAASRNDGIGNEEPPGDELGLPPEEPPIEIQCVVGRVKVRVYWILTMDALVQPL